MTSQFLGAGGPMNVLLVEDSASDALLTKEALKDCKITCTLNVVNDGAEAIAYLRHEERYHNTIHPDIILLDLNLPKKSGFEVLSEIKKDAKLKHIPVIVLTTSKERSDIVKAYDHRANCYIVKPAEFDALLKIMRTIEDFWFSVVKLPGDNADKEA